MINSDPIEILKFNLTHLDKLDGRYAQRILYYYVVLHKVNRDDYNI